MTASIAIACVFWALGLFDRHFVTQRLAHYAGFFPLLGPARLAACKARSKSRERVRASLLPFVRGAYGAAAFNVANDPISGKAAACLLMEGNLPEAAAPVRRHADRPFWESPSDADGNFYWPRESSHPWIWIDAAAAVTPCLLLAGREWNRPEYLTAALKPASKLVAAQRDPTNGLVPQALGYNGPACVTEAYKSRGNGWAPLALTERCADLPECFPDRSQAIRLYGERMEACLRVYGLSGLWHQELPRHDPYVETSDSGLMLYALGVGLDLGQWPTVQHAVIAKGLNAFLDDLTPQRDVFHTCRGCLAPSEGCRVDDMAPLPFRNDPHAFGPQILICRQVLGMPLAGGALARSVQVAPIDACATDLVVSARVQKGERGNSSCVQR